MSELTSFPIKITDQLANESVPGLCPPLLGDVAQISTASTEKVVSEYGFRKALTDEMENKIVENNIGTGAKVCETDVFNESTSSLNLEFRRIKFCGKRFTNVITNRIIGISYDNAPGKTILNNTNIGVQGGTLSQYHVPVFTFSKTVYDAYCTCGITYNNFKYNVTTNSIDIKALCPLIRSNSTGYNTAVMNIDEPEDADSGLEVIKYGKNGNSWSTFGNIWPWITADPNFKRNYSLYNTNTELGLTRFGYAVKSFNPAGGIYTTLTTLSLSSLIYGGSGYYYAGAGWNFGGGKYIDSSSSSSSNSSSSSSSSSSSENTESLQLLKYTFTGDSWDLKQNALFGSFRDMGFVANNGSSDNLYKFGGHVSRQEGINTVVYVLNTVCSYNSSSDTWFVKNSMATTRSLASSSRITNSEGVIMGGGTIISPSTACLKYNANSDTWTIPTSLSEAMGSTSYYT